MAAPRIRSRRTLVGSDARPVEVDIWPAGSGGTYRGTAPIEAPIEARRAKPGEEAAENGAGTAATGEPQ